MKAPIDPVKAAAARLARLNELSPATRLLRAMLGGTRRPSATFGTIVGADQSAGPASEPVAPGVFAERRWRGGGGSIDYKLYVPPDTMPATGVRRGLIVMLHGCTQSPDDFARGTRMNLLAAAHGFLVAWPAQSASANAQKCWNWFRPADQQRDRGEPALIAGLTRAVIADHDIDPAQVYVAGLSAGGAAAAVMGAAYPDLYAAIGVHSGIACGAAHDVSSALAAMRRGGGAASLRGATEAGGDPGHGGGEAPRPVIIFHGDHDRTVDPINAQEIAARAAAAAGPLTTTTEHATSVGGRHYTREVSRGTAGRDGGKRPGRAMIEAWTIHGGGHAWSGGDPAGSFTDPAGPDASAAMIAFFLQDRS